MFNPFMIANLITSVIPLFSFFVGLLLIFGYIGVLTLLRRISFELVCWVNFNRVVLNSVQDFDSLWRDFLKIGQFSVFVFNLIFEKLLIRRLGAGQYILYVRLECTWQDILHLYLQIYVDQVILFYLVFSASVWNTSE
eukprot:TRINITY_DN3342_c0_g2_i9.p7 TRINITY_DN3342_c0_g2~~TRINITY_DN3342_c0_g2_i9.p7  ORF type:complete len:138 (+),score=4.24 TRINITY_DN3342_c0_g2_i9:1214-1627(+)